MDSSTLVEKAIAFSAQNGVPVFPCRQDKSPLTRHGFKDASSDPAVIRELFADADCMPVAVAKQHINAVWNAEQKRRGPRWCGFRDFEYSCHKARERLYRAPELEEIRLHTNYIAFSSIKLKNSYFSVCLTSNLALFPSHSASEGTQDVK